MSGGRRATSSRLAVAVVAVIAAACGIEPLAIDPPKPEELVATIQVVSGANQRIWSGRKSMVPFRIRALDAAGAPLADAVVSFTVAGAGGGDPSQPHALTDGEGYAESWLFNARAGEAVVVAEAGRGRAELPFVVDRAVGRIEILPGTGQPGLPGRPHPDSVLVAIVTDTDGRPLPGQQVWFAAPGDLAQGADTTDAAGRAETRLRATYLSAGPGDVYAFVLAFPGIIGHDVRLIAAPAKRVVLVSVEGLRADAIDRWGAPNLRRLAREGAYAERALTVSPALTAPAHLSMLAGVSPEEHGILADQLTFTPAMVNLDPVFKHATRQGRRAAAFISRDGPLAEFERALACRLAFGLDSLYLTPPRADAVIDAAAAALRGSDLDLLFLHFPDPDLAGHEFGYTSARYGEAVLAVDAALGRLAALLADQPGTLLVVTSDHGGGGAFGDFQHGSDSAADTEVPLLLWGARVSPARLGSASILDVAPTMLWALGMAPPASYRGSILLQAFR